MTCGLRRVLRFTRVAPRVSHSITSIRSRHPCRLRGRRRGVCVKASFAEYLSAGVTFAQRLQKEAWGGRDFIVRDPDGNMLSFVELDGAG